MPRAEARRDPDSGAQHALAAKYPKISQLLDAVFTPRCARRVRERSGKLRAAACPQEGGEDELYEVRGCSQTSRASSRGCLPACRTPCCSLHPLRLGAQPLADAPRVSTGAAQPYGDHPKHNHPKIITALIYLANSVEQFLGKGSPGQAASLPQSPTKAARARISPPAGSGGASPRRSAALARLLVGAVTNNSCSHLGVPTSSSTPDPLRLPASPTPAWGAAESLPSWPRFYLGEQHPSHERFHLQTLLDRGIAVNNF